MILMSMIDEFPFPVRGIASGSEKKQLAGMCIMYGNGQWCNCYYYYVLGRKLISLSGSRYMVSDWLTKR